MVINKSEIYNFTVTVVSSNILNKFMKIKQEKYMTFPTTYTTFPIYQRRYRCVMSIISGLFWFTNISGGSRG